MDAVPWQVRIAEKSLKKKEKIRLLEDGMVFDDSRKALDVGCAQGTLSYFLRRRGGFWISADEDWPNLKTSQGLLATNLVRMPPGRLPFRSGTFDLVTCLDYLEHIDNDEECLQECFRVLKKGGEFVVAAPQTGKLFLLHRVRAALGMKLAFYGHKREGYSLKTLSFLLEKNGFEVVRHRHYSRFFSEGIELALNFVYINFLSGKPPAEDLRDGRIKPSTGEEFGAQKGRLKAYFSLYPLIRLLSRLDFLLFFLKGYGLIIWAKKTNSQGKQALAANFGPDSGLDRWRHS